jgi:hypothetical protein
MVLKHLYFLQQVDEMIAMQKSDFFSESRRNVNM